MAIICSDDFIGIGGTTLAGRTSSGGQTWSAQLDLGHSGEAVLYPTSGASTKLGSRNSLPDSSALYYLSGTPPTADYGINFSFEFGTLIPYLSVAPLLRFQDTVPTALPTYYMLWYNGTSEQWQMWYNLGSGLHLLGTLAKSYTLGSTVPFTFRVCGTTLELFESGVSIMSFTDANIPGAGHAGIAVPNCNANFSNTAGWWITNFEADSLACTPDVELGLYFAGSGIPLGEDFSVVDYGLPTSIVIPNPVAGQEYTVEVTPVDLAGFVNPKMGNIKLRRSCADPQSSSPVVFRGLSLIYKKNV